LLAPPICNPCLWFAVEGLAWWVKDQPLSVPVLTTGPASLGSSAGNLGAAGTTVIRSPLDYGATGGVRFTLGAWFDTQNTFGIEGSAFFLQEKSTGFGAADPSGTGNFVINEPLAGATFNTQVSGPGMATGAALVSTSSCFAGGEINGLFNIYRDNSWSIRLLGGFRYLELNETLTVTNSSTLLSSVDYTDTMGNTLVTAPAGSFASAWDFFGTRNQFYGGQLGARFEGNAGRWIFSGAGKLALGATHEVITINGNTLVSPVNAGPVTLQGGNFATSTNSGRFADTRFAVAPEIQLSVGYQLGAHVCLLAGYNFLWLSSVARPGNQMDNVYDGVTRPGVPMASSSFWAQGLTFSCLFRY
jgi:hypothetical protein